MNGHVMYSFADEIMAQMGKGGGYRYSPLVKKYSIFDVCAIVIMARTVKAVKICFSIIVMVRIFQYFHHTSKFLRR
jgi:hypothetical protein